MRWITAGESHGQALSAIVEGLPAHIEISTKDIDFHLSRRRLGVGRGAGLPHGRGAGPRGGVASPIGAGAAPAALSQSRRRAGHSRGLPGPCRSAFVGRTVWPCL